MSGTATVEFYGIKAELPPGNRHPLMVEDGEAIIASGQFGNSAYRCVSHAMTEVFAATAAMRWRDVYASMEHDGEGRYPLIDIARKDEYWRAVDNSKLWDEIRRRSIQKRSG